MGIDLGVKIGGLNLRNPVLVASGTFGYEDEYKQLIPLNNLGAFITKTITLKARPGNRPPRIIETSSGILNSIGLQNEGVEDFIKNNMPRLLRLKIPIIVSIAGDGIEEYAELAKRLSREPGISALEINISCPNVEYATEGECLFAQDIYMSYGVVKAVRESSDLTLIAKLSPNVTNIVSIARAVYDAGCDAVSLVNTFFGMAVDIEKRRPKLGTWFGGLSGPAIKPLALYMVYRVAKEIKLPIIGIGGIATSLDALEFIISGATAIAIGTANFLNPKVTLEIIGGIEAYLKKNKISSIKELIGTLKT